MRNSLTNIYESMLITEVVGAINYWLTPDAKLIKVDYHMEYAYKHFKEINWVQYMKDYGWKAPYEAAYKAGYIRVVEETANILISYSRSKPPTKQQFSVLVGLSEDKEKNLIDSETNKVILKQNEIEPTSNRPEQLTQLDRDLEPSFYKKRRTFGDSFSKYEINDYTKLIYEYNIDENLE